MKKYSLIAATAAVLALAACSSGDDAPFPGSPPTPPTPPVVTPPMAAVDAFFTLVKDIVAAQPDDAEPVDITSIALTAPEDSEPVAF